MLVDVCRGWKERPRRKGKQEHTCGSKRCAFVHQPPPRYDPNVNAETAAIVLKDVTAKEEPALFAIFAAVRAADLRLDGGPADVRDRIVTFQFEAQRRGYREQFPGAREHLIVRHGRPIGWLVADRGGRTLHVIDIALLQSERGRGTGSQVLRALQVEAAAAGKPMMLTVQRWNSQAIALYRRLGFQLADGTDVHVSMRWSPDDIR